MMLVAVETAGPDPGTAASSLHLGPGHLAQSAAGEQRTQERILAALGHPWPQPLQSHLSQELVGSPRPTPLVLCAGCPLAQGPRDGRQCSGPWPPPLLPATWAGGSSHPTGHRMALPGTSRPPLHFAFAPKPFTLSPRLHPPGAPPQALLNVTQTWGRWDTVPRHTGSPMSVAKPHHLPGRCLLGARLPPIPGASPLHSRAAQLIRDAGMMEYPAGAEEARQNLSIHQGPHFLPSALGDN